VQNFATTEHANLLGSLINHRKKITPNSMIMGTALVRHGSGNQAVYQFSPIASVVEYLKIADPTDRL
jgi:hypothetical protein